MFFNPQVTYFLKYFRAKFREILMNGSREIGVSPRSQFLLNRNFFELLRMHCDVPTDKIVLSSGAKISKRPLKRGHWWLKNKERKCHFRFVERRFLAAINCT